jgi:phage-related holin
MVKIFYIWNVVIIIMKNVLKIGLKVGTRVLYVALLLHNKI